MGDREGCRNETREMRFYRMSRSFPFKGGRAPGCMSQVYKRTLVRTVTLRLGHLNEFGLGLSLK